MGFLEKQRKCVEKMNLGGTNTVWTYPKNGGPPKAKEVPNGKIRPTTYIRTYHGPKQSRGTTKPE